MKPAPFAYAAPDTLDAALALVRRYGQDGKVLAGGQSLVPLLNMRRVAYEGAPPVLSVILMF